MYGFKHVIRPTTHYESGDPPLIRMLLPSRPVRIPQFGGRFSVLNLAGPLHLRYNIPVTSAESNFGSEAVSHDIRVSVRSVFDVDRSDAMRGSWFFRYTVTITNEGDELVQLMDRHWIITDEAGRVQEVRGSGVVGEQPVLDPGESFEYTSGCPLTTATGTMWGSYRFVTANGTSFDVKIAEFILSESFSVH